MRKKIICCGVLVSTLLSGVNICNTAIAAETQGNISNVLNNQNSKQQSAIQNIDEKIDNMLASIPPDFGYFPWVRTTHIFGESIAYSGTNIQSTNQTNAEPIHFGENIFPNETPVTQTYRTAEFTESVTNTTSTQTQNGFKTGMSAGGKVGIPFVAEGKVTASLEYNFSHTNTNTQSKTNTLTAPAQSVIVPPGKTYRAEVYLEKKKTSGTVELYADVLTGVKSGGTVTSIGRALGLATNKHGIIQTPNDPDKVRVIGNGNFTTEYGTYFFVKIFDITEGEKSAKLVDTKKIPLR